MAMPHPPTNKAPPTKVVSAMREGGQFLPIHLFKPTLPPSLLFALINRHSARRWKGPTRPAAAGFRPSMLGMLRRVLPRLPAPQKYGIHGQSPLPIYVPCPPHPNPFFVFTTQVYAFSQSACPTHPIASKGLIQSVFCGIFNIPVLGIFAFL